MVVLGRGDIVGKPMAAMLCQKARHANATVTVCHSRTRDLPPPDAPTVYFPKRDSVW